jgi:acylphosphatase
VQQSSSYETLRAAVGLVEGEVQVVSYRGWSLLIASRLSE